MKIHVIFTGGTIGSKTGSDGYISPSEDMPYRLLELYRKNYECAADFITKEPYRILSENLKAENLIGLIQCVQQVISEENPEGIIITHGTDTLQYTAAVLGYVFGGSNVPVVLVSSDFVLDDLRANGLTNFAYAVKFIQGGYGNGVFVSYCNQGGIPYIHRATRLQTHTSYSADVFSTADSWYGRFVAGMYEPNPNYRTCPGRKELFEEGNSIRLRQASSVLRIVPYPGMTYPHIPQGTKAVLHESFHSGTIGMDESLKEFATDANARNIPIYLTGLSQQEAEYETVDAYRRLGIIPLPESATIAQYCKLWLITDNDLSLELMNESVAEDLLFEQKSIL
jgi:L-asparaginase